MVRRYGCRLVSAMMLLPVLLLFSCSSSGPAPSPSPEPSGTFAPAPAPEAQKAKIAVCTIYGEGSFDDVERRINDAIAGAGQNVEFDVQTVQNPVNQSYYDDFIGKVKTEISAQTPTADAFLLPLLYSRRLFDASLTMDLAELLRRNAPVYCSKYGDLFHELITGVPVGIFRQPMWNKSALMLRDDFVSEGGGVSTVEGLFGFIDDSIVKPKKKQYEVCAYENDLVLEWALDKGYYPLVNLGLNGFVCCGADDAGCAPVLIEDITGFADFIITMKRLRKDGCLQYPFESVANRECVAFVYGLDYYYYPSPYLNIPIAEGSFTAQLLAPERPGYFTAPAYGSELAVPKLSGEDKAAAVIRFVEWMYAGQDCYDSVIYGEKGVDFVDEAGKYAPLIGGKPLSGTGYEQMQGLFFMWPGATDLSCSDLYRMPSTAPKNVAELTAEGLRRNNRFPLDQIKALNGDSAEMLENIPDDVKAMAKQRDDIIYSMIQCDPATFTEESLAGDLESLGALKNQWLLEQYTAIIQKLADPAK